MKQQGVRGAWLVLAVAIGGFPAAHAACPPPPEPGWCDVIDLGPDMLPGTLDDEFRCAVNAGTGTATPCSVHSSQTWEFATGDSCRDCVHDFYVRLACGRQLQLLVDGASNLTVTAVNVDTGAPATLVAANECAVPGRRAAPLLYCEACAEASQFYPEHVAAPEIFKPAGSCDADFGSGPVTMPVVPCLKWRQEGETIAVGPPLDLELDADVDEDGDGWVDAVDAACTYSPFPIILCECEPTGNRVMSGQRITVRMQGEAPGVYRIRIAGGGARWTVSSSCTLHDSCALAVADPAGDPALPLLQFPLDERQAAVVVDASGCPSAADVAITVCNEGGAAAAAVPVRVVDPSGAAMDLDLAAHPTDPACQAPLLPGECRTCRWMLPIPAGTLQLDPPPGLVDECGDDPTTGACRGAREAPFDACAPAPPCFALARLAAPARACAGRVVTLHAAGSWVAGCAGTREIRFEADGVLIPGCDWGPSETCDVTPAGAGRPVMVARVRCSAAPACEAASAPRVIDVSAPPELPGDVVVVPEGDCALRVTWEAASGAFSSYRVHRSTTLPVPLDAAHRVASGVVGNEWTDHPPWGFAYAYRIEATGACDPVANAGGDSSLVAPQDLSPPAFAGIADTRDLGSCQVEVTWPVAEDDCSGIAGYDVYRDHGVAHAGETLVASMVPASPYVDTTPGNGTWVYVVRAVNGAGLRDANTVFQQESEGSCTNDFPRDAGMDDEDGIDSPNADGGRLRLWRGGLADGLRIRWRPSPDEGGPYPVTYDVLRGELDGFRTGRYTHRPVAPDACGLTVHEYLALGQDDGVAAYYLVAAVSGDNVTAGYDGFGRRLQDGACR